MSSIQPIGCLMYATHYKKMTIQFYQYNNYYKKYIVKMVSPIQSVCLKCSSHYIFCVDKNAVTIKLEERKGRPKIANLKCRHMKGKCPLKTDHNITTFFFFRCD